MDFDFSSQTISWIRDRYRDGELVIEPPYQRRPVWGPKQRSFLIESILLSLPIPEIYMQDTTSAEGKTIHGVVDGQQRIRTILQFLGAETDPEQTEQNKFRLDKLPVSSPWYNAAFAELTEDVRKKFYAYRVQVRHLKTENEEDVRDMFRRLNKYLTPLNAQELRNATYTGPFVRLCDSLADDTFWVESGLMTPAAIRRMNDIEFVSELLIGTLHGPQSGSAASVDAYYETYEEYEEEFPDQKRAKLLFDTTLTTIRKIFPRIKEQRWSNKTDFYSLFLSLSAVIRSKPLTASEMTRVRKALIDFAHAVDKWMADEHTPVSDEVTAYGRAVQRGANDKARRAQRHEAIMTIIARTLKRSV
jgi:Protein of unknown function DUF262